MTFCAKSHFLKFGFIVQNAIHFGKICCFINDDNYIAFISFLYNDVINVQKFQKILAFKLCDVFKFMTFFVKVLKDEKAMCFSSFFANYNFFFLADITDVPV